MQGSSEAGVCLTEPTLLFQKNCILNFTQFRVTGYNTPVVFHGRWWCETGWLTNEAIGAGSRSMYVGKVNRDAEEIQSRDPFFN